MSNDVKNFLAGAQWQSNPGGEVEKSKLYGHEVPEESYYKARAEQSGRTRFRTKYAPPVQALVTLAGGKRLHIALEFRSLGGNFVGTLEFRSAGREEYQVTHGQLLQQLTHNNRAGGRRSTGRS